MWFSIKSTLYNQLVARYLQPYESVVQYPKAD